jgi:hypothetical protein
VERQYNLQLWSPLLSELSNHESSRIIIAQNADGMQELFSAGHFGQGAGRDIGGE